MCADISAVQSPCGKDSPQLSCWDRACGKRGLQWKGLGQSAAPPGPTFAIDQAAAPQRHSVFAINDGLKERILKVTSALNFSKPGKMKRKAINPWDLPGPWELQLSFLHLVQAEPFLFPLLKQTRIQPQHLSTDREPLSPTVSMLQTLGSTFT